MSRPTLVYSCRVDPRVLVFLTRYYRKQGIFLSGKTTVIELALRDFASFLLSGLANATGNTIPESLDEAISELALYFPDSNIITRRSRGSISQAFLESENAAIHAAYFPLPEGDKIEQSSKEGEEKHE